LKDSKKSFSEFAGMFGEVNDGQVSQDESGQCHQNLDEEQRARIAYARVNPKGLMETYKDKLAIPAGGMTLGRCQEDAGQRTKLWR
jgi:hypothetical protein